MAKRQIKREPSEQAELPGEIKKLTKVPLERIRSADFKLIYSNGVQVAPTRWDIQFIFEQIVAPPMGAKVDKVEALQQLAVVMSVEHAKAFLDLFAKQMNAIQAGKIPMFENAD